MIKSMTGFGKATAELGNRTISLEIRSLNSKQLDVNARIPQVFREKEFEIRAEINRVLERGKIDLTISLDNDSETGITTINRNLAKLYHNDILALAEELNAPLGDDLVSLILKMPDVMKTDKENLDETEWARIKTALLDALQQTNAFRTDEGALLEKDMRNRIIHILSLLEKVADFEHGRIKNLRERFEKNQSEFVTGHAGIEKFDENRFEQEIFWYLEKLDVTEEKIRLKKHCDYFLETLSGNESSGRKLGFITQEIGREINTLGSKASDADIQRIVVQMKDELEKIKEQLGNIL